MGFNGKVGFIGAGKMGGAVMEGMLSSGMVQSGKVLMYEPAIERATELSKKLDVKKAASVQEVVSGSDVFFICVKPDQLGVIAPAVRDAWHDTKPCCVSIMAGVKSAKIQASASEEMPVIRVMPNIPCIIGKGVAGVSKVTGAPDEVSEFVYEVFEKLGGAVWVDESKMDAVTALSGSGPAYVYMFIEALADAGVRMGLDRATSEKLAIKTVSGASELASQSDYDTLQLRAHVSSPGGTTVAATSVLEDKGFRSAVIRAVEAAWKRSIELGG